MRVDHYKPRAVGLSATNRLGDEMRVKGAAQGSIDPILYAQKVLRDEYMRQMARHERSKPKGQS